MTPEQERDEFIRYWTRNITAEHRDYAIQYLKMMLLTNTAPTEIKCAWDAFQHGIRFERLMGKKSD
jgi:hypothetical protein